MDKIEFYLLIPINWFLLQYSIYTGRWPPSKIGEALNYGWLSVIPSILGDRSNLRVHSNLGDTRRFHSNLSSSLKSEFVTQIWGKAVLFPQIWVTNSDLSEIKNHLLPPKHSQRNICGCRYHSHNWRSYTGSNSLFVFLHNKRLAVSKLQGGISSLQTRNCINELGHVHVIFRFYRRRRLSQSFRRLSNI